MNVYVVKVACKWNYECCIMHWHFTAETSTKNYAFGTSLVVQWLRLHAPNAGALVRSLVGELDPACCN